MRDNLKSLFLLDPEITYLNHGSFGACPRPVFEVYQTWQKKLERQPVQFMTHELLGYLEDARRALAKYLGAHPDELVYIPNATYGVNLMARSLELKPGDQVLTTNHEYGACMNAWNFHSQKFGFEIVRQQIPLPLNTADEIIERIWRGVTDQTRVIFISHITSPTAIRFPVKEICRRARQAGILTLIDGAHAPGQVELKLNDIGADFYVGNCHKWMMAPKGSAFLYAQKDAQQILEPLVVSWGWGENRPWKARTSFLDELEYTGTNDYSAYLSVPAAIDFMNDNNWQNVRAKCHQQLCDVLACLETHAGLRAPIPRHLHDQMGIVRLPTEIDGKELQKRLWDEHQIEVPCTELNSDQFLRISVQCYNTPDELDRFCKTMSRILH